MRELSAYPVYCTLVLPRTLERLWPLLNMRESAKSKMIYVGGYEEWPAFDQFRSYDAGWRGSPAASAAMNSELISRLSNGFELGSPVTCGLNTGLDASGL